MCLCCHLFQRDVTSRGGFISGIPAEVLVTMGWRAIEDGNNGIVIDDVNKLADGVIKASMLIRINEQGYKSVYCQMALDRIILK